MKINYIFWCKGAGHKAADCWKMYEEAKRLKADVPQTVIQGGHLFCGNCYGSQQTSERHLRILFRFRTASASSIFKPWSLRKFFLEVLYSMSWLPWESSRLSPNCLQHSMYACAVATFHASPLQFSVRAEPFWLKFSVRAEHQKFSCGLLSCVEPQQAPRPQHVRRLGLALCARSPAGGSDGLRASWLLGQLLQRHL